jgi:hypothetical protein
LKLSCDKTALLSVLLILFAGMACGQLVNLNGGRALGGEASGGTVGLVFSHLEATGSIGIYGGEIFTGASLKARLGERWSLLGGDQPIELGIPVDDDYRIQMLSRGAGAAYNPSPNTSIRFFGGMTGGSIGSKYVLSVDPVQPIGFVAIDRFLGKKKSWLVFSRAVLSDRQTVLGGVQYHFRDTLETGLAAGIGSNQPHLETMLRLRSAKWDIRSRYVLSGDRFHLISMPQFQRVEPVRENIDIHFKPIDSTTFTVSRNQYLYSPDSGPSVRGSTDRAGVTLSFAGFTAGANAYESHFRSRYASATSFSLGRSISKSVYANADYYMPLHAPLSKPYLVFSMREQMNRRFTLSQFLSHSGGRWSVNYGGGLRWDRLDFNVGYATSFVPLAAAGASFRHSVNVDGALILGHWVIRVRSIVQPDGHVQYEAGLQTYFSGPVRGGSADGQPKRIAFEFPKYLIRGRVILESTGLPLADAPLTVDGEKVFTNENGEFSLRVSHRRRYRIALLLSEPIGRHYYDFVSGPKQVSADVDEAAPAADFVVRINPRAAAEQAAGIVVGGR